MQAISVYPGSCGELLQGCNNGVPMLISCPINLFTRVKVFELGARSKNSVTPSHAGCSNSVEFLGLCGYLCQA